MCVFTEKIVNILNSVSSYKFSFNEVQRTNSNINGDFTILLSSILKNVSINKNEFIKLITDSLLSENIIISYEVINVFLNIKLSDEFIIDVFNILSVDNLKNLVLDSLKRNIVVEYSSPNTNKPLHLGHLRNIFIGYSLCQILKKCGYNVHSVTLVNDRGIHICKSMIAYELFGDNKTPEELNVKGDHFVGDFYVKFDKQYKEECKNYNSDSKVIDTPIMLKAKDLLRKWEDGDEKTLLLWKKMNSWVLNGFNVTYKTLGIKFDKEYFESNTFLLGKDIVNYGLEKNVFYKMPDNSVWVNLEDVGMDKKLLLRSDGTSVYITQDIGTVNLRYKDYKFDKMLYVVGDEQIYHFKVLNEILKKLNLEYCECVFHVSYGMVELPNGRMKSREGTVVDADDLIEEMYQKAKIKTEELNKLKNLDACEKEFIYKTIGLNSLRFFLLKVDPKKKIVFDPDKSIDFNGDTAPFIMYSYVRIVSLLSKNNSKTNISCEFDIDEIEKQLIFTLAEFKCVILKASTEYNPSFLAQYLLKIAKEFNKFYENVNIGKIVNRKEYDFCILLINKIKNVIEHSFYLLGMKTVEHM